MCSGHVATGNLNVSPDLRVKRIKRSTAGRLLQQRLGTLEIFHRNQYTRKPQACGVFEDVRFAVIQHPA